MFKMTISSDDMMHFIDKENIVTYAEFGCGFSFYPTTAVKVEQINREWKNIARSFEKPMYFPKSVEHNCSIDTSKEHTSKIFLSLPIFGDMHLAAIMTLNHTTDGDSMSNQYLQTMTNKHKTEL